VEAITDLVVPGGEILVSCRSRNVGKQQDTFPLALDRNEIDGFLRAGLSEAYFLSYDDDQDPPVPHYFAVYKRPAWNLSWPNDHRVCVIAVSYISNVYGDKLILWLLLQITTSLKPAIWE
jgi:hypothetical protein